MAGNQLISQSKLMYYPTQDFETYRILGLIGRITLGEERVYRKIFKDTIKKLIGEDTYNNIIKESLSSGSTLSTYYLYDYFLKTKQYDFIKKYFKIYFPHINKLNENITEDESIVIADLQAGEGEWLNTFTSFIPHISSQKKIECIANELEEDRYKKILEKNNIKHTYLGSTEELQIPKQSISLLLFNPPYGETNGERNVRRYLRMTIERNWIKKGGVIVLVIREDDAIDIANLLCSNFFIYPGLIYKVNEDEYNKYKQYVIIATKMWNPLDLNTSYGVFDLQKSTDSYLKAIRAGNYFSMDKYNNHINLPTVNLNESMENFKYVTQNNLNYCSKKSQALQWIKEISELKDMSNEQLVLPKSPKLGEISNIIASGYINSEMNKGEDNHHIVVGGTKSIEKEEISNKMGDDGKEYTETKVVRYSQPYLNLLINKNGKLEIKELGDDTE